MIYGSSEMNYNPPSAYAVERRDHPKVADQLWTYHTPKGPQGRYDPCNPYFWAIWNFSRNIPAAKSLLGYLMTRPVQEKLVTASVGSAIPPYDKSMDFKIWEEEGPPNATNNNYPPRHDAIARLAGYL